VSDPKPEPGTWLFSLERSYYAGSSMDYLEVRMLGYVVGEDGSVARDDLPGFRASARISHEMMASRQSIIDYQWDQLAVMLGRKLLKDVLVKPWA
jgi:hypothetical protein